MEEKLYVTPKMIKEFSRELDTKMNHSPSFHEILVLMHMYERLLAASPPMPYIEGQMSKKDFMDAYDSIPFVVNRQLAAFSEEREQNERIIFPDHMDVICMQHLLQDTGFDQTIGNVYAFTYVYQGECSYTYEDQVLTLHAGDLFIATPGFSHRIFTKAGTFALLILFQSSSFNLLFNDFLTADSQLSAFFRKAIAEKETGNYCVISTDPDDKELPVYIQSLVCECIDGNVYSNSSAACLLKLFLSRAYIKYSHQLSIYRRDLSSERVNATTILRYIQNNYQDISLPQLAEHFHYNRTYISRFIHKHFGKTFVEIVNELKVDHAKEYLRKTNKRMAEIAPLVGFESYDHFSRTFRKYTGMPPGTYRKMALEQSPATPSSSPRAWDD